MFNPARAKNRSILCALRQYTSFSPPPLPYHYSFYAPLFRIGIPSHFIIIRSCLLLRLRSTPTHLASALTIFLLAYGSNRLATLKHLNNPRGLLFLVVVACCSLLMLWIPCCLLAVPCWCCEFLVVVGIPFVVLLSDVVVLLVRCQGPPKGLLAIDVRPSFCQCYP
jgi:hypothetical protein